MSPEKLEVHFMKKLTVFLCVLLGMATSIQAQEVFVNADFVSSYIWRGAKLSNAAIQPTLGFNWKGLTISAWGSTEFRNENNEIDLNLEYEYKNLTLCVYNYFNQYEDEPFKYFNYNPHSTGHTFEAGAAYEICEKFPLTLSWYTTFAGNDYREDGKRAWSSYCEASYPFSVKGVDLSVEAGFTPWKGMYSNKFNVVNVGLSATKEFNIKSKIKPSIFGKLIANPSEEQLYFVFGVGF